MNLFLPEDQEFTRKEVIRAAHFCAVHGTQTKNHWNLHVISTKSVVLIQTGADS